MSYIYHHKNWPAFSWDSEEVLSLLSKVKFAEGKLSGKMFMLGFHSQDEALLQTLTQEVLKTSSIEGEVLDNDQVRSSVARKLGMDVFGLVPSDRNVDGVVDMIYDATKNHRLPLSKKRLSDWHHALFPTGRSGLYEINTGKWRDDKTGPMQVVSGAMGRERVHFQAPAAAVIENEMKQFLKWFEQEQQLDPVLKSAVSHLWFVTIHPFDDGNGRIARALADMQLTRADGNFPRYYSMSAQIRKERNQYYSMLEKTQRGDLDITDWISWYLKCLHSAILAADTLLAGVLAKANFWIRHRYENFNERQLMMINRLFDGFEGKLTSTKWSKIARCSSDTALRDIQDLVAKGVLCKEEAGGRSTAYELETDPPLVSK
ncbi:MAG: Fic family protein [Bacteroidota bacterium]